MTDYEAPPLRHLEWPLFPSYSFGNARPVTFVCCPPFILMVLEWSINHLLLHTASRFYLIKIVFFFNFNIKSFLFERYPTKLKEIECGSILVEMFNHISNHRIGVKTADSFLVEKHSFYAILLVGFTLLRFSANTALDSFNWFKKNLFWVANRNATFSQSRFNLKRIITKVM